MRYYYLKQEKLVTDNYERALKAKRGFIVISEEKVKEMIRKALTD